MDISKVEKDIIQMEDGYYYFCPGNGGGISSKELREIADYLDKKNSDWDDKFKEYWKTIKLNSSTRL